MAKPTIFKACRQHQPTFLPQSLEKLIPEKHLVRVVSQAIDEMNLSALQKSFRGGGAGRYHPVMMLKVLVYAYTQRLCSSRQIVKAIRENVHCMWLAGDNRPDCRTINRFRSSRLQQTLESVFTAMVQMLPASGMIRLEDCFVDGRKPTPTDTASRGRRVCRREHQVQRDHRFRSHPSIGSATELGHALLQEFQNPEAPLDQ